MCKRGNDSGKCSGSDCGCQGKDQDCNCKHPLQDGAQPKDGSQKQEEGSSSSEIRRREGRKFINYEAVERNIRKHCGMLVPIGEILFGRKSEASDDIHLEPWSLKTKNKQDTN